jgi:hypothetical protein
LISLPLLDTGETSLPISRERRMVMSIWINNASLAIVAYIIELLFEVKEVSWNCYGYSRVPD